MKLLKYRIFCVDDNQYEYVWVEQGGSAPTQCPINTNHTVAPDSASIAQVIDNDIKPFRQVLGKDDLSMSPRTVSFKATPGEITIADKTIDTPLSIRGGIFYCENSKIGDWVQFQVIDSDNILGYDLNPTNGQPISAVNPLVLREYVPEWSVIPKFPNELIDISIGKIPYPGLKMRCIYHSTGVSGDPDVECLLNIISYEDES